MASALAFDIIDVAKQRDDDAATHPLRVRGSAIYSCSVRTLPSRRDDVWIVMTLGLSMPCEPTRARGARPSEVAALADLAIDDQRDYPRGL
jgi:hypothetical protein